MMRSQHSGFLLLKSTFRLGNKTFSGCRFAAVCGVIIFSNVICASSKPPQIEDNMPAAQLLQRFDHVLYCGCDLSWVRDAEIEIETGEPVHRDRHASVV